jgi:hypothetical protein
MVVDELCMKGLNDLMEEDGQLQSKSESLEQNLGNSTVSIT